MGRELTIKNTRWCVQGTLQELSFLLFWFVTGDQQRIPLAHCKPYCSAVQPAARGPHAARQLVSCGPPVLAKFVRNNIMCKISSKRQNLTSHLTISTQIKFFKFIKYMVLNPQIVENVM